MTPASPAAPRIAEIAARLKAATPGPWHAGKNVVGTRNEMGFVKHIVETCWGDALPPDGIPPRHDMDLIAHAPADIAHLLAENARLEADVAELQQRLKDDAAETSIVCRGFQSAAETIARLSAEAAAVRAGATEEAAKVAVEPMTDEALAGVRGMLAEGCWKFFNYLTVASLIARLDRAEARGAWRPTREDADTACREFFGDAWFNEPEISRRHRHRDAMLKALEAVALPEPPRAGEGGL